MTLPKLNLQQYIDGKWVDGSSDTSLDVENPATEEVIASFPDASIRDIEAAIIAARRAFDDGPWSQTSPRERADKLRALAGLVRERKDEIIELTIEEGGAPRSLAEGLQVGVPADHLTDLADRVLPTFPFERALMPTYAGPGIWQGVVRREPVGVVSAITPFNYPNYMHIMKLGPSLAAGNTVVLKPSAFTPLSAMWLAGLCQEVGFPPGVINVVTGDLEASRLMTTHPAVDMVTFTGSEGTGKHIMEQAAGTVKKLLLELGGKSACILLDDVAIENALGALLSFTRHAGQGCAAQTRVLVHESRYDETVELLVKALNELKVGDPKEPDTMVGPLVNDAQRSRVERYVAKGTEEGAQIACGGKRPAHIDKGYFFEPTLFVDVKSSMTIAQEEIFGPVGVLIPFHDDDEAVAIANDTHYGLSGSVWSAQPGRAYDVAKRVRTGQMYVNVALGPANPFGPFGGYKQSGLGREFGEAGLDEYLETKTVMWSAAK
jgi:aldehyde dehydrogenase (NAD+)